MKNPTHEHLLDTEGETVKCGTPPAEVAFWMLMFLPAEILGELDYKMLGMSFMASAEEMIGNMDE